MIKTTTLIAAAALALSAGMAHSGVVFSDNFDQNTYALDWPGDADFTSTQATGQTGAGSTDLIGVGTPYDFNLGHGKYVDLDGTGTGKPAGQLTSTLIGPGSYTLSFDLAGNQRGGGAETTEVSFGGVVLGDYMRSSADPFATVIIPFSTATGGTLQFTEVDASDNVGNLLDNVSVSVPEPASWAMMLLGLGAIGGGLRISRRKESLAVA